MLIAGPAPQFLHDRGHQSANRFGPARSGFSPFHSLGVSQP